jgi:TolB protein
MIDRTSTALAAGAAALGLFAAAAEESNPYDTGSAWSADGRSIYFYSYRHGDAELYRMAPDGSHQTRLTDSDFNEWWPQPLPDAGRLLVVSDRDAPEPYGGSNLYRLDLDSGEMENLTNLEPTRWATFPGVAAAQNLVVFQTGAGLATGDDTEIKLLDLTTGEIRDFPDDPAHVNSRPTVSADGARVAYLSVRNGTTGVYVNDLSGRSEELLLEVRGQEPALKLSPDGAWIAVVLGADLRAAETGERGGEREIFIARTDGSAIRRLTTSPASDHEPNWSPDGRTLTFSSYRHGPADIFAIDIDGTHERNLTSTSAPRSD